MLDDSGGLDIPTTAENLRRSVHVCRAKDEHNLEVRMHPFDAEDVELAPDGTVPGYDRERKEWFGVPLLTDPHVGQGSPELRGGLRVKL